MSESNWNRVEFQQFTNEYGIDIIVNSAPTILSSKQDKEKEEYISFISFLFLIGGLSIYLAISIVFSSYFYSDILAVSLIIIIILSISSGALLLNFLLSNIYIKPIECWIEIFKGISQNNLNFYCFIYYPIFSGKCHPNEALNILSKLYQEKVYGTTIDITKIEVYVKLDKNNRNNDENLGFFFRYAEGFPFNSEDIEKCVWKFFPFPKSLSDNYFATGNWAHHYEWRYDLTLDYDKLNSYAPWIIKKWDETNLKPLTNDFKYKIKLNKKFENTEPKLVPWQIELNENISMKPELNHELQYVNEAIDSIFGKEIEVQEKTDIEKKIFEFKAFFRDLEG